MDELGDQVKQLANSASCEERHQILDAIKSIYHEIDSDECARARVRSKALDCCVVALTDDLNVFRFLAEADGPLSTDEIAEKANASPGFVRRLLSFLASRYYICEVAEDTFTSNKLSQTLALYEFNADIHLNVDVDAPAFLATPRFLKNNGYRDITDPRDCPFQLGRQTDRTMHEWVQYDAQIADYYNRYMLSHHKMMRPFTDVYPIEELLDDLEPDQPFFVDVGGGFGHQALSIKVTYPYTRVILEELPLQLQNVEVGEDVELVAQDFFEEQKIKGARIYYLRHILHDCPDADCISILRNLADAMNDKSVILVDETVMPPTGANYHATLHDIAMMSLFGAKERTKTQWERLLDEADRGLKIRRIAQYSDEYTYSIVEIVKLS